jgi:uncharacterized protein YnzC (UPF0291/DUF896 family)
MAKRVNCLVASEREKECTEHHFSWTGKMPCTGLIRCMYCNTTKSDFDNSVNDIVTIDTDLEDQRAEMLQEMAEDAIDDVGTETA